MSIRTERVENLITQKAGMFINRISDSSSLITVTHSDVSNDLKHATIYISVLPQDKEDAALSFFKRNLSDFRNRMKNAMHSKNIPFFEVEIDKGAENRRRIEEILDQE